MHYTLTVFILLVWFLQQSQAQCIFPGPTTHPAVRDVLAKVILHQDYRRCSSVDTTYQRRICEIWDEADEISLRRMTCSTGKCSGVHCVTTGRSFRPCADGSFNKTCVPHDNGEAYTCACQSAKHPDPCPRIYQWDSEWRDITSGRQGLFRQLCNQTTQQCVATEYLFGVAHLVKHIPLPDGSISASSEYGPNHSAKRVRIDNYFSSSCGWAAAPTDPTPYIQFDFPQNYVVIGILLRARCDPYSLGYQTVKKINIRYSLDNLVWNFITPLIVSVEYGNTVTYTEYVDSFTHFFEEAVDGRYWKITMLEYLGIINRGMKADLIGRLPVD